MAYNKRNYFTKIAEIQKIVLEYQDKGCTQVWIFRNIIKPKYFISMGTFNRYLSIPARSELKKLENSPGVINKPNK